MNILSNILLVTFMGLIAIIAGMFEDLESDVASTSNPNSQVQLAPQVGKLHKYFNRAISGEPLMIGFMSVISGSLCYAFLSNDMNVLLAIFISSILVTLVQAILSITSYMGRITSQSLYNQPLFMDMLYKHIPTMMAFAFVTQFSIVLLSYIMTYLLVPAVSLSLPVVSALMGITLGSIGSAVGDIHYGAEKLYQNQEFGSGLPVSNSGNIVRMSSMGSNNSIDVLHFCSKFAGPLTGLAFGTVIFLSFWTTTVFKVEYAFIVSIILVIIITLLNYLLEKNTRKTYGKYQQ
ncbi:tetrahydromethanopterin S-methyltransferase subunit E [Methanosphaera sp. BMS]|uniref:tetrahydromethanopterin S-methyltransferase subunit E n=1 Tax=Methanosphaera sp. BMS TaxID=1789762 RepID=UPI000DC1DDBD|nr:tetrahydromethanopterin S-methyltransferase subunit E [Methanosphaera sp. BMS]AWX32612.1 tetrahydromethanopterin S-methyltransferase subunit E [Methanosphaera sp. BMS]